MSGMSSTTLRLRGDVLSLPLVVEETPPPPPATRSPILLFFPLLRQSPLPYGLNSFWKLSWAGETSEKQRRTCLERDSAEVLLLMRGN